MSLSFGWWDQVDDPVDCPYPDCDGQVRIVTEHYGADADGRRGVDIYYAECNTCERDPDDYDPEEWEDYDDEVG